MLTTDSRAPKFPAAAPARSSKRSVRMGSIGYRKWDRPTNRSPGLQIPRVVRYSMAPALLCAGREFIMPLTSRLVLRLLAVPAIHESLRAAENLIAPLLAREQRVLQSHLPAKQSCDSWKVQSVSLRHWCPVLCIIQIVDHP